MEISLDDIGDVLEFVNSLDCAEVEIEVGDVRISVRRKGAPVTPADQVERAVSSETGPASRSASRSSLRDETPQPEREHADDVAPDRSVDATRASALAEAESWLQRESEGTAKIVRSPMVGTAYRAKEPGADPFVDVGQRLVVGDVICLVEVMKLFHSITTDVEGKVGAILFADGDVVEHHQPLIAVDLSS